MNRYVARRYRRQIKAWATIVVIILGVFLLFGTLSGVCLLTHKACVSNMWAY